MPKKIRKKNASPLLCAVCLLLAGQQLPTISFLLKHVQHTDGTTQRTIRKFTGVKRHTQEAFNSSKIYKKESFGFDFVWVHISISKKIATSRMNKIKTSSKKIIETKQIIIL